MTAKTKSAISKIGWYQIIGGGVGVLIIIYSVFNIPQLSVLNILVHIFILLFFAYSIFCGILCLHLKHTALRCSLINQFLQIVGIAIFGFAFSYVAGLYLSVGLDLSKSIDIKLDFGISKFGFNVNRENERIEINFNLVAIGLIYWIYKLIKSVKSEEEIHAVSAIGQN